MIYYRWYILKGWTGQPEFMTEVVHPNFLGRNWGTLLNENQVNLARFVYCEGLFEDDDKYLSPGLVYEAKLKNIIYNLRKL